MTERLSRGVRNFLRRALFLPFPLTIKPKDSDFHRFHDGANDQMWKHIFAHPATSMEDIFERVMKIFDFLVSTCSKNP